VNEALTFMDADGAFSGSWKYDGGYGSQPMRDVVIYQLIRGQWNTLRNREMEEKFASKKSHR